MTTKREWEMYLEPDHTLRKYYCEVCDNYTGEMRSRKVTDSDGIHREYKIVCKTCQRSGPLHWSKNLSEHSWRAINQGKGDWTYVGERQP